MKKVFLFAAIALVSLGFMACNKTNKTSDPALNEAEFIYKNVYNKPFADACATLEKNGYVERDAPQKAPSKIRLTTAKADYKSATFYKAVATNDSAAIYITAYNAEVVNNYALEFCQKNGAYDMETCGKAAKTLFTHTNSIANKDYSFEGYLSIDEKPMFYANPERKLDEEEKEELQLAQAELAELKQHKDEYIQEMGEEEYYSTLAELESEIAYLAPTKKEADFAKDLTANYKEDMEAEAFFLNNDNTKIVIFNFEANATAPYAVYAVCVGLPELF